MVLLHTGKQNVVCLLSNKKPQPQTFLQSSVLSGHSGRVPDLPRTDGHLPSRRSLTRKVDILMNASNSPLLICSQSAPFKTGGRGRGRGKEEQFPLHSKDNSDQGFPCMGWRKAGCLPCPVVAWMVLFPGHLLKTTEDDTKWVNRLLV